jgi:hypothetical protein
MKFHSFLVTARNHSMIGLVLSLLLHALLLLFFIEHAPAPVENLGDDVNAPLTITLLPPSDVTQRAQKAAQPAPTKQAQPQKKIVPKKVRPTPPTRLALQPKARNPTPVPQASAPTSMMDMLQAARDRRRAAGVPDANDNPEQNKPTDPDAIARANIEFSTQHARGNNEGGGLFDVRFKGVRTAELVFYGWDQRRRREHSQLIEIDAGLNGDIDSAIIRKVIEVIREKKSGDFTWHSSRLGHDVTLSARPQDTQELTDFLKKDFFDYYR